MINVILNCFKKLAPRSIVKRTHRRCSSDSISSEKQFSQMRFSKGVIGFEYLPVSILYEIYRKIS